MKSSSPSGIGGIDARFSSLFVTYYDDVLGYCVRRTDRAEADDIASEVFAVAWRRIDDLEWETAKPWLFGIARRILANNQRSVLRRGRLREKVSGLAPESPDTPEVVVIRREQDQEVIAALSSLQDSDSAILTLSGWEQLSAPEIAIVLNISTSAAEQRLHRAKQRFTKALERSPAQVSPRAAKEGGGR
jgi:RNA polymerase sigma-70 factor (ECF subfamily)